jgi:hypothetical protein
MTTKTTTQGNMTIRTATSSGHMIHISRTIIKEMITTQYAMYAMGRTTTRTKRLLVMMIKGMLLGMFLELL